MYLNPYACWKYAENNFPYLLIYLYILLCVLPSVDDFFWAIYVDKVRRDHSQGLAPKNKKCELSTIIFERENSCEPLIFILYHNIHVTFIYIYSHGDVIFI